MAVALLAGQPAGAAKAEPVSEPASESISELAIEMAKDLAKWSRGHYFLPAHGDLVGDAYRVKVREGQTLLDIAREHNVGYEEIRRSNPGVSVWAPEAGREVVVPARFILPAAPREGIVINIAELRLYYYPEVGEGEASRVETYPIGIGREGYNTPLGVTKTTMRLKNPAWYPPRSMYEEAKANGEPPPQVVPPGPDNPLGTRAILLDIPGYLIHGTNKPDGIGMRVSRGCIRMYPEDISTLFQQVPEGTPVNIVNQPIKAGWRDGIPYVQAYTPLEKQDDGMSALVEALTLLSESEAEQGISLDYQQLREVIESPEGLVVAIQPAPEPEPETPLEPASRGLYAHVGLQNGFFEVLDLRL